MDNTLFDGKPFDALFTPLGADFAAGYTPDFLCVRFEEGAV